MAGDRSPSADVVQKLKPLNPAKLRVRTVDGGERLVAVSSKRKKWEALTQTLDQLDWTSIEALNAKEEVLGVVHEEVDYVDDVTGSASSEATKIVSLVLKAQDIVLRRQKEHDGGLLEAMHNMLGVMTERVVELEQTYSRMLKMTHDAVMSSAEEGGELGSEQLVMAMFPDMVKMAKAKMAAQRAAAANGASNGKK